MAEGIGGYNPLLFSQVVTYELHGSPVVTSFFLCCSHRQLPTEGTILKPIIVASDPLTEVECAVNIKVYGFTDTVDITLEETTLEDTNDRKEDLERIFGEILGYDIFVTSITTSDNSR